MGIYRWIDLWLVAEILRSAKGPLFFCVELRGSVDQAAWDVWVWTVLLFQGGRSAIRLMGCSGMRASTVWR